MKSKITCEVILDLIPLVKDGVASEDSTAIVNEHIEHCEACKAEFDFFETVPTEQPSIKDKKIIAAIKRSVYITQLTILIIGAIVGIALTNSFGMFYNFLIMPIIGAVSLLAFKRKWYLAPIIILGLSYVWQSVAFIITEGFQWVAFYSGLFFSLIYMALVLLGSIIAFLLKFAFKKGEYK
ncbi:zf-HC2 domain-containing protein [Bacillus sp. PS06]|uniref:zf-HC2 domain-containing protein n=1 Tax=Bacillus sp. PS06 TaxID=2764176 RepID=UPI0017829D29|nr:zf-HC2 domain-containing protein [Bacillus sp. PS06]MBD8068769.1 zf-HC2 domain-containing protein [Bacillus sp. PS06]